MIVHNIKNHLTIKDNNKNTALDYVQENKNTKIILFFDCLQKACNQGIITFFNTFDDAAQKGDEALIEFLNTYNKN